MKHLGEIQGAFFMPRDREKGESDAENAYPERFRHVAL